MRNYKLSLLLSITLLVSCKKLEQRSIPRPENLISYDKMVKITTEAHLIEAALQMTQNPDSELAFYSLLFYKNLFEKNQINGTDFIENLKYYTEDYYKAQEFYNDVQEELNTLHEKQISEKPN